MPLVHCAALFGTDPAAAARAALTRVTLAGMSVGAGSPNERLGVDVVMGRTRLDGQFKLVHAGQAVAPDSLVGDVAEEP
jgi:hypothetical protein